MLARFTFPALLENRSTLGVALVTAAVVLCVVMFVAHGVNARTATAVLGTLMSLGLVGLLGVASVLFTLGLVGITIDCWRMRPVIVDSPVSLEGVLNGDSHHAPHASPVAAAAPTIPHA